MEKKNHQILNNVLEKTTLMISTDQRFFADLSNYNNLDMYDGYKLGCPRSQKPMIREGPGPMW